MNKLKHILVVDDDIFMVKTLLLILNRKGYQADGANSGKEALEMAINNDYQYVITDVKMSGMTGIELFREIKKVKPNLPVLLMTAYTSFDLIDDALEEGAVDCMTKPLDIDKLLSILLVRLSENKPHSV